MQLNEYRINNIINYQYKGSILQGTITSISKTKVTVNDKISLKLNSIIPKLGYIQKIYIKYQIKC